MSEYTIDYFKNKGVEIYTKMPKGWVEVINTHTQPRGTIWICNNKSIFSKDYKNALLIIEGLVE